MKMKLSYNKKYFFRRKTKDIFNKEHDTRAKALEDNNFIN